LETAVDQRYGRRPDCLAATGDSYPPTLSLADAVALVCPHPLRLDRCGYRCAGDALSHDRGHHVAQADTLGALRREPGDTGTAAGDWLSSLAARGWSVPVLHACRSRA